MLSVYVISAALIFYGNIVHCEGLFADPLNQVTQQSKSINQENSLCLELPQWIPSNCAEALMGTQQSGIYAVKVRNYGPPFLVYCDANTFGGNWTVVQRRQDGSVDFNRNWTDYKRGIGNLNGEFFIGLDKLYALTAESPQELLVELEDFDNEVRYARYNGFAIGAEDEDFAMKILGDYSGNANDSLSYHRRMKFTTRDRDNDVSPLRNCADEFGGGYWFANCLHSNLNGPYIKGGSPELPWHGVNWSHWRGLYYSYKSVRMLIRPKNP